MQRTYPAPSSGNRGMGFDSVSIGDNPSRMHRDQALGRLRDLQSVTDAALSYLPLEDFLEEMLARVIEILDVDTAVVLLLDDDNTLTPRASKGLEEEIGAGVRIPVGAGFAGRVAALRQPIRIDDPAHADIVNPILRQKGLKALLGVPLVVQGSVIGVLHVGALSQREFTEEDADVLGRAADRAALAIYGRITERERGLADALQRSLIPTLPEIPGVGLAGRYLPAAEARLGGDWYDAFLLPGGRIAMAIGDVVGRGFHAAALMGQLRSGLRAYALDGISPGGVLTRLSNLLRQLGPGRSATLVYLVVDPQGGHMTISGAGHPAPLIVESDGTPAYIDLPGSVPLGSTRDPRYSETEMDLRPGSTLVLFTDGLVERAGEALETRLEALCGAATVTTDMTSEALCERIVRALLPDGAAHDDAAVLVARALPLEDPLRLRHAAEIDAIPLLRRVLARWLAEAGASKAEVEDIALAFSEACANAAEHAYAPASGVLEIDAATRDGAAVVTVRDFGNWREPRGNNRGRGLILMQGLMDSVDVRHDGQGTTIELSRRLSGSAA
jgi:serine phosphatase RsbU (regulator of sigma subunit)/anti-sigma regulatory factor (Ser/Thr protein kinase)